MTTDLIQQARAYRDLMSTLVSAESFTEVALQTAQWAMVLCEADGSSVCRREGDDLIYVAAVGTAEGMLGATTPMATSFTGQVIRSKEARIFDPGDSPRGSRERAQQHMIGSGIVVPFLVGGEAVGALGVTSTEVSRFDGSHRDVLRALGEYVALGVERLRAQGDFRRLLECVPDGVAILRRGRLVYTNPALALALGSSDSAELSGAHLWSFVDAADHESFRQWIRRQGSLRQQKEVRLRRFDGQLVVVELSPVEQVVFEQQMCQLVVIRDVTARRLLELQLVQADRLANIGALAAGMMHEINNPLAYLMTNLDLAREMVKGALCEGDAEGGAAVNVGRLLSYLDDAADGAHRVRDTVRALRSFARADESGVGPVSISQILDSAIKMAGTAIRHHAELLSDIGEVPLVLGDESRLLQVFLNILTNALQAVEHVEGERRVTVRCRARDAEVFVEIEDTGQGIAPEALEQIFQPFYSTKVRGEGTGIGLSISRGLVESIGGRIEVESELGVRSLFRVVLPRADSSSIHGGKRSGPPRLSLPAGRRRLLVIDDEPLLRRSVQRLLGDRLQVTIAESGVTAKDLLAEGEDFDLILCDLMMPGCSGPELFEWIRRERGDLIARMSFMTGGAVSREAREFLSRGAVHFLEKPFDEPELVDFISRRLAELRA